MWIQIVQRFRSLFMKLTRFMTCKKLHFIILDWQYPNLTKKVFYLKSWKTFVEIKETYIIYHILYTYIIYGILWLILPYHGYEIIISLKFPHKRDVNFWLNLVLVWKLRWGVLDHSYNRCYPVRNLLKGTWIENL